MLVHDSFQTIQLLNSVLV